MDVFVFTAKVRCLFPKDVPYKVPSIFEITMDLYQTVCFRACRCREHACRNCHDGEEDLAEQVVNVRTEVEIECSWTGRRRVLNLSCLVSILNISSASICIFPLVLRARQSP
jgi:hypothetical protein